MSTGTSGLLIPTGIATMSIISTNTIHRIPQASRTHIRMCTGQSNIRIHTTQTLITSIAIDANRGNCVLQGAFRL